MPEGNADNYVAIVNVRQQNGAGPSTASSVKSDASTGRRRANTRRVLQQRQLPQRQDVIDLTDDRADDDDVQITQVKNVKRPRLRPPNGVAAALAGLAVPHPTSAAALPLLAPMTAAYAVPLALSAAPAALPLSAPPPSPKGYKCTICLDRMEGDLATTTCGHMYCYNCILAWVQKSANCPQCRTKLTKSKIIRIYPPS